MLDKRIIFLFEERAPNEEINDDESSNKQWIKLTSFEKDLDHFLEDFFLKIFLIVAFLLWEVSFLGTKPLQTLKKDLIETCEKREILKKNKVSKK